MGNKIVSVVQLQELCAGIFSFGKACLVSLMVPWPLEQCFSGAHGDKWPGHVCSAITSVGPDLIPAGTL